MKNKLFSVLGVGAVVGLCAFVPSARAQAVDNSNDTVHCETITKGSLKFKPALNNTDQGASQIKVQGTLGGCSSPSNPALVFPEGKSKFKGLLNSPTSGCLGLLGPSGASGDIVFTWGVASPGVLFKTSTVHLTAGDSVGGFTGIGGGQYGQFGLGTPNGGGALAVDGGFTGGSGGVNSGGLIFTQQSVATLGTLCSQAVPLGIKAINIAVGQIDLQ